MLPFLVANGGRGFPKSFVVLAAVIHTGKEGA